MRIYLPATTTEPSGPERTGSQSESCPSTLSAALYPHVTAAQESDPAGPPVGTEAKIPVTNGLHPVTCNGYSVDRDTCGAISLPSTASENGSDCGARVNATATEPSGTTYMSFTTTHHVPHSDVIKSPTPAIEAIGLGDGGDLPRGELVPRSDDPVPNLPSGRGRYSPQSFQCSMCPAPVPYRDDTLTPSSGSTPTLSPPPILCCRDEEGPDIEILNLNLQQHSRSGSSEELTKDSGNSSPLEDSLMEPLSPVYSIPWVSDGIQTVIRNYNHPALEAAHPEPIPSSLDSSILNKLQQLRQENNHLRSALKEASRVNQQWRTYHNQRQHYVQRLLTSLQQLQQASVSATSHGSTSAEVQRLTEALTRQQREHKEHVQLLQMQVRAHRDDWEAERSEKRAAEAGRMQAEAQVALLTKQLHLLSAKLSETYGSKSYLSVHDKILPPDGSNSYPPTQPTYSQLTFVKNHCSNSSSSYPYSTSMSSRSGSGASSTSHSQQPSPTPPTEQGLPYPCYPPPSSGITTSTTTLSTTSPTPAYMTASQLEPDSADRDQKAKGAHQTSHAQGTDSPGKTNIAQEYVPLKGWIPVSLVHQAAYGSSPSGDCSNDDTATHKSFSQMGEAKDASPSQANIILKEPSVQKHKEAATEKSRSEQSHYESKGARPKVQIKASPRQPLVEEWDPKHRARSILASALPVSPSSNPSFLVKASNVPKGYVPITSTILTPIKFRPPFVTQKQLKTHKPSLLNVPHERKTSSQKLAINPLTNQALVSKGLPSSDAKSQLTISVDKEKKDANELMVKSAFSSYSQRSSKDVREAPETCAEQNLSTLEVFTGHDCTSTGRSTTMPTIKTCPEKDHQATSVTAALHASAAAPEIKIINNGNGSDPSRASGFLTSPPPSMKSHSPLASAHSSRSSSPGISLTTFALNADGQGVPGAIFFALGTDTKNIYGHGCFSASGREDNPPLPHSENDTKDTNVLKCSRAVPHESTNGKPSEGRVVNSTWVQLMGKESQTTLQTSSVPWRTARAVPSHQLTSFRKTSQEEIPVSGCSDTSFSSTCVTVSASHYQGNTVARHFFPHGQNESRKPSASEVSVSSHQLCNFSSSSGAEAIQGRSSQGTTQQTLCKNSTAAHWSEPNVDCPQEYHMSQHQNPDSHDNMLICPSCQLIFVSSHHHMFNQHLQVCGGPEYADM